ncbi:MAG TPA: LCP family protein, partial [Chloroflexota bacterium]|nr:LCP family protein [Chloroflexota bacterium]
MSRAQGLYRPPEITPRPVVRRSRIWRPAILVLVVYALGLIPFYFLTPVHDALPKLLNPADSLALSANNVSPTRPTPSKAEVQKKVGADSVSIAAPTTENAQDAAAIPSELANDTRYAFLLLGYGGAGHDGAYLSDSMIVVVVDPDRKTLSLVSIPRDSWVPMTFDGKTAVYNKVNTAYAFGRDSTLYPDRLPRYDGDRGAGVFAADTVSRLLGVPIRYYMGIDFVGFRQMIDTVGGVDVEVPATFSARYPANDDPSIDASWKTVRFTKGPEHMSGERAIEFARAREAIDNLDEGSDFARSRRQRLIIEAFKQRVLQPAGLIHLPQLLGLASTHIDTNYSIPDVAGLSQLVLD